MKKLIMKHPVLNVSLIVIFALQNLLFDGGLFSTDNFFGADGIHQISSYIMMLISVSLNLFSV